MTAVRGSPDTTTLDVSWTPGTDNHNTVTYRVRVTGGTEDKTETATGSSSHTVTGLVPGTQYTVHVRAETADGSQRSTEVSSDPVYTSKTLVAVFAHYFACCN